MIWTTNEGVFVVFLARVSLTGWKGRDLEGDIFYRDSHFTFGNIVEIDDTHCSLIGSQGSRIASTLGRVPIIKFDEMEVAGLVNRLRYLVHSTYSLKSVLRLVKCQGNSLQIPSERHPRSSSTHSHCSRLLACTYEERS